MSNNDSFIDEVNEEVQRDRLFQFLRRYGWIGVVLVLLLVGGAAWTEWRKAQARAVAEARGDAILAALQEDTAEARAEALGAVDAGGGAEVVRDLLRAAQLEMAGEAEAAVALLDEIAGTPGVDPIYRDMARLKAVMFDTGTPEDRLMALEPLARPGAPYRLLALEQIALTEAGMGDTEAALETANAILEDAAVSQGLRERAQNLIVALGGALPGSAAADAGTAEADGQDGDNGGE